MLSPVLAGETLLFVRDGRGTGVPLDLDGLEVTGTPVPLIQGVETRSLGRSDLALSRDGTLAYMAGDTSSAFSELVWVDRTGTVESVDSTFGGTFDHVGPPTAARSSSSPARREASARA